jgi:hypothetical protein
LLSAGVSHISIHMACDNPKQYTEIMKPTTASFSDMCTFVVNCVESGM